MLLEKHCVPCFIRVNKLYVVTNEENNKEKSVMTHLRDETMAKNININMCSSPWSNTGFTESPVYNPVAQYIDIYFTTKPTQAC